MVSTLREMPAGVRRFLACTRFGAGCPGAVLAVALSAGVFPVAACPPFLFRGLFRDLPGAVARARCNEV